MRDSARIKKMKQTEVLARRVPRGQFNLISSNDEIGLTVEEQSYLYRLEGLLKSNKWSKIGEIVGEMERMFGLYLQLGRQYPNEAGVRFMVSLFNS